MSCRRRRQPDPILPELAMIYCCAPTREAVLTAAQGASRPKVVVVDRDELVEVLRRALREELNERPVSDRQVAERLGIRVRTWQQWVRESRELAALAEPGPGPRSWRMTKVESWHQLRKLRKLSAAA